MAAFDRLAANPPTAETLPAWPRSVRLGIDYSVSVAANSIADMTPGEADSFAWTCTVLGMLQERDPPDDPPATCAAQEAAEKAGPFYAQAFALLGFIRDTTATLLQRGIPVPALPSATMALLQKAARGERVPDAELDGVLEAAQRLRDRLGFRALG